MTLKTTIAADRAAIFLNQDEGGVAAIWTPKDGIAQPEITVLFINVPMHGDEQQDLPVVPSQTAALVSSADSGSMKARDTILINSTTYKIINNPYPLANDDYWSVLDLRYPLGHEPLI